MRSRIVCLTVAFASFHVATVAAGDLVELPTTQEEFKAKIAAFIKPGGKLKDAMSILQIHRFECSVSSPQETYCVRNDHDTLSSIIRRYQVVLNSEGSVLKSVRTNTGLVGP